MAIRTQAQLLATIATGFLENSTKDITEEALRTVCVDIADTWVSIVPAYDSVALLNLINSQLADNTTQAITAAKLKAVLDTIVEDFAAITISEGGEVP